MNPAQQLNLGIRPQWGELAEVRRQIAAFLRSLNLPTDDVDAVSMVGCELSENAVKYGTVRGDGDRITLSLSVSETEITVEVSNRVSKEDEENLSRLDRMVQWIRGYHDPFEAYLQRLKELSSQPLEDTESRLGLVRIAYEGQAVLDFYVDEQDLLSVSAIRQRILKAVST